MGNNLNAQCGTYNIDCSLAIEHFECSSIHTCQFRDPTTWDSTKNNCNLCDASRNNIMWEGECGNCYFLEYHF